MPLRSAFQGESRVVKVPTGPLVRVEGQSVSIRCDVSDYEGPPEQDFEWSLFLSEKVPLISTFDQTYTAASMRDRVNSGDISVKKLADDAVELTIRKVRASDTAVYRCSTPSTDSVVKGNYFADVELKVIGDSLKVAPVISQPTVSEGESVKLLCNISRSFTEHTFLSVTWSIRTGSSSLEEILTFGPDDGIKVGPVFAQRYADDELIVLLPGGGSYGLILKGVKPKDQGVYVCTGREWTKQPAGGKGWQNILERSEDMGSITVTPLAQSLVVSVEKNVTLSVEETLKLTCSVAAKSLRSLGIEVIWLVKEFNNANNQRVLLHVGHDGQVLTGSELVSLSRVQQGMFKLLLSEVQPSDSGLYSCQMKFWLPLGNGGWYQAAEKISDPVQVQVTQLEPDFQLGLTAPQIPQFTNDPTELLCEVTNLLNMQDGRLSVTWYYAGMQAGTSQPITIASLDHLGVLVAGDLYQQLLASGNIAVTRSGLSKFGLRLLHTRDKDMGNYSCSVAAWTRGRQGDWNKAKELKSATVTVQWSSKTPVLRVAAKQENVASTVGSTFEMICQVTGQNIQNPSYSVLILFEETPGGKSQKLLSLSADSVLKQEEGVVPSRAGSVALEKTGPQEYRFRLNGAQVSDRGFYYCNATAWTRDQSNIWNSEVSAESNKIQLAFDDTGPVFNVSIYSDSSLLKPGDTVKMKCIMDVQGATSNTGEVAYDVQWFQSPTHSLKNGAVPLISMDQWGVVKKSKGNESIQCSIERTDRDTFVLSVYHVQDRDMGEYYCMAKLWHFSSDTGLWNEGQQLTSSPVFLSINLA
ncbi:prostaglandin F2 receptor negative regulator-like, partial [Clarias magur]